MKQAAGAAAMKAAPRRSLQQESLQQQAGESDDEAYTRSLLAGVPPPNRNAKFLQCTPQCLEDIVKFYREDFEFFKYPILLEEPAGGATSTA